MIYGSLPQDLGLIDLRITETMHWMYCPVSLPGEGFCLPDNLKQFVPILREVWNCEPWRAKDEYMYLTAKRLWVGGDYIGNRPGWHSDGFGTDDLNFIWSDCVPTDFLQDAFEVPVNCADSMALMAERAKTAPIVTFDEKHLLRLDQRVIHRPPVNFEPGMRTFVKVSISKDRYNLEGNSINHGLGIPWPTVSRQVERNHPFVADHKSARAS